MLFALVQTPFDTHAKLSQDDIDAALRTIDRASLVEDTRKSHFLSTPIKQQPSPSTSDASPSIPYNSPLCNRSLLTPTYDRSTIGMI